MKSLRAVTLTLVSAFVLAFANLTPGEAASRYVPDGAAVPSDFTRLAPALDSPVGKGRRLQAGVPVELDAGPAAPSAHSALVRITVFQAADDTTVNVAAAPALSVTAGTSASSTVLVPLTDGRFTVSASATVDARAEVLATFGGPSDVPGSTTALPEAVNRPGAGAAVPVTPGDVATFGVTGRGVPAADVRAVHVSVTVDAPVAASLDVDGQGVDVPKGRTTVSTIVTPDADGSVAVGSDVAVTVRMDVRGWVAEAPQFSQALNGPGAFWPEPVSAAQRISLDDDAPTRLTGTGRADADRLLALVTAAPTAVLTTLHPQPGNRGRAEGALVDPVRGAQPQLLIIDADDPRLAVRRGTARAEVVIVGGIVGDEPTAPTTAPRITVESPDPGRLDLTDTVTFTFSGSVDLGDLTPLRIEVRRDGEDWGTAALTRTDDGLTWTYQAAVREAGLHEYTFELVGRDGTRTDVSWSADITIPGPDDLILREEAVALGWPGVDQPILATEADYVDFAERPGFGPGDVIAGGAEPGSPVGLLRRVTALDELPDRWRVHTEAATFEDMFLQVSRTAVLAASQPGLPRPKVELVESSDPTMSDPEFRFVPMDEVDLGKLEHEGFLEAEEDDSQIDEPPTDWEGRAGLVGPMAMPRPREPRLDDPTGPSQPPPTKPAPSEGTDGLEAGDLGWTFVDEKVESDSAYHVSLDVKINAQFGFVFKLQMEMRWTEAQLFVPPLPYPVVTDFETALTMRSRVDLEGKVLVAKAWQREMRPELARIQFNPITLFIGPVPVVITSSVNINLHARVAALARFELSFKQATQAQHRLGFSYREGVGARRITEASGSYGDPVMGDKPVLQVGLIAMAGPEVSVKVLIYDAMGPTIGVGLKAALQLQAEQLSDGVRASAELFLQGSIFVKATVKVPIIDVVLTDVWLVDETYKWILLRWQFEDRDDPPEPPDPDVIDAATFAKDLRIREVVPQDDGFEELPVAVRAASWVDGPPSPTSVGVLKGDFSLPDNDEFFTQGAYPVLSTGASSAFFTEGDGTFERSSGRGDDVFDVTTLKLDLARPAAARCVEVRYLFGSDDTYLEGRDDAFVMEWGRSTWTSDDGVINAPDSVLHHVNDDGVWFADAVQAVDDSFPRERPFTGFAFRTSALMFTRFMLPEDDSSTMFLSIADLGGSGGDTAVAIDNITFFPASMCDGWESTYSEASFYLPD